MNNHKAAVYLISALKSFSVIIIILVKMFVQREEIGLNPSCDLAEACIVSERFIASTLTK